MTQPIPAAATQHIVMLQSLHNTQARLVEVVEALPVEAHDWHPAPEEWSLRQTLSHLAAAEPPFYQRLCRIVAELNPWLPYFGPEVARPDHPESPMAALTRLRAERERVIAFLSGLSPEDWERPAVHETMGPTTLAQQAQNLLNHDLEHLGQLHLLKQAWETQRVVFEVR
jgi:uncharacterized damage-inducible protein DinB